MACPEDFDRAQSRWDDMEPDDVLTPEETEEVEVETVKPQEAHAADLVT